MHRQGRGPAGRIREGIPRQSAGEPAGGHRPRSARRVARGSASAGLAVALRRLLREGNRVGNPQSLVDVRVRGDSLDFLLATLLLDERDPCHLCIQPAPRLEASRQRVLDEGLHAALPVAPLGRGQQPPEGHVCVVQVLQQGLDKVGLVGQQTSSGPDVVLLPRLVIPMSGPLDRLLDCEEVALYALHVLTTPIVVPQPANHVCHGLEALRHMRGHLLHSPAHQEMGSDDVHPKDNETP
mmetsp:Transcript_11570/g.36372  ORF Transcript_11570/g.36372 Transcript_11570/m.36372 type:complete len:239 (-) Transcript_11570:1924-2640(-)